MIVLKWVLIVIGVVLLVFIVVAAGGLYWVSTVESVKLTVADLKVGGSYPAEERQALLDACKSSPENEAGDKAACTCVADKAGTEFSRAERLMLVAGFEESPTKLAAIVKGLLFLFGDIQEAKVDGMRGNTKQRINGLIESCGIERWWGEAVH